MQTHQVKPKTKRARSVQIGRGGTRGKTSGRGHKGQKQHGGHGIRPEMRDIIKKLPKLRGRGVNSNKSIKSDDAVVTLAVISINFKDGEKVTPKVLARKNLVRKVSGKFPTVKVVSTGELDKKIVIEDCKVTGPAKVKIEKAGGQIK
ncbi:MAG: large subunit ribosomal protein L15 [Candidatus Paceibacteria bacterium]|jgi:large subunit ribosomal protein L15